MALNRKEDKWDFVRVQAEHHKESAKLAKKLKTTDKIQSKVRTGNPRQN